MKGLKNHMGDNAHSNIDSLIVQSKLQEMMKMAGGGMVDKKIPGYMGGGMMKKKKGAYGYQEGGKVLYDIGADFDKKNISQGRDGMFTVKRVLSVPANQVGGSEGLRYYSATEKADDLQTAMDMARLSAEEKMSMSPSDSMAFEDIDSYLKPKKGIKGLLGMLGMQQGGQASPDPLNIDARSANPSMYQGSVVQGAGGMLPMQGNPLDSLSPQDSLNAINEAQEQLKGMKANKLMQLLKSLEPEQEPELLDSKGSYSDSLGSDLDPRIKFPAVRGDKKPMDFMQNFLYSTPR